MVSELETISGDFGHKVITRDMLLKTDASLAELRKTFTTEAQSRGLEVFWRYEIEMDLFYVKWRPAKETDASSS